MKYFPCAWMLILAGCTYHNIELNKSQSLTSVTGAKDTSWISTFDIHTLKVSDAFDSGKVIGEVDNPMLDEISGIASSYSIMDALWVEEDSGNPNQISLLSNQGKLLGDASIEHIANRDWEDMSIAVGPTDGIHYIYLADIGDNDKRYDKKYIYRFSEPAISSAPFHSSVSDFDIISFSYPDGIKNAESVMIDPLIKDVYLISKESDKAVVYRAGYPQPINKNFMLEKIGTLPIPKVTAADISPDGKEIIMKNYTQVFYWTRNSNEPISTILKQNPQLLPYQIEIKGESVCFASDLSGFFTTSEADGSSPPPVHFYKRR